MNAAVDVTTGQQSFAFFFFSRHAPCQIGVNFPDINNTQEGVEKAHAVLRETHQNMARKYRAIINRERKNQRVEMGSLVGMGTKLSGADGIRVSYSM